MENNKDATMRTHDRNVAYTARKAVLRDFGRRLNAARKNSSLTQRAVGEHMGVSAQTVRNWEAGRNEPTGEATKAIAALYGVPYEELQDRAEETRPEDRPCGPHGPVKVDAIRLKTARRASGFTQKEAAERSGSSLFSIRRYEQGVSQPSDTVLNVLAVTYERQVRWFIQGNSHEQGVEAMPMDEALRAYALV